MTSSIIPRRSSFACTTMAVGKKATADGSLIVSHTDDDISDGRIIYVPAADHHAGSMRMVYYDDCSIGPNPTYNATEARRYIGTDRGPGYDTHDYKPSNPLGSIPQVQHTYAYFDSSYGVMNEHQLSIGECTCGARVHPDPEPGKRIFYSSELARVALERCKKAREAVELMGGLIAKYGYYGTGETLLLGDTEEAWVMEMCGYDMEGSDGIWVARRVPDDSIFVAANEFRIRTIDPRDPDLLFSDNLFDVCSKLGWWDPLSGSLDWLVTVSNGEYSHAYYSLRRVWRALSKAAPSAELSPWVENGYTTAYPFAVVPDKPLTVADIADIHRDSYEGTEFDLTKGLSAGPWGDPTRYDVNPDQNADTFNLNAYKPDGAWERPLSIYRCGFYWINQSRSDMPYPVGALCWLGLHRPSTSCLIPVYPGLSGMPIALETMSVLQLQRESAWWAFAAVGNYASLKWSYMIKDIKSRIEARECMSEREQLETDIRALEILETQGVEACKAYLGERSEKVVNETMTDWWRLLDDLMVKYNSGGITTSPESIMAHADYPRSWLSMVGFFSGPIDYKPVS
ncbi:MAG TPA: C69 family dipeptidase [Chlorobaculum sp.]|nr:C69 family dipeptidase [Chlorobaculum sp.]